MLEEFKSALAKANTLNQLIDEDSTWYKVSSVMGFGTGLLGAYHGYKRNCDSIGWAIGWALLGSAFWPIVLPVMVGQAKTPGKWEFEFGKTKPGLICD